MPIIDDLPATVPSIEPISALLTVRREGLLAMDRLDNSERTLADSACEALARHERTLRGAAWPETLTRG